MEEIEQNSISTFRTSNLVVGGDRIQRNLQCKEEVSAMAEGQAEVAITLGVSGWGTSGVCVQEASLHDAS